MSRGTGWTKEQLLNHPKRDSLLGKTPLPQDKAPQPPSNPPPIEPAKKKWVKRTISFAIRGNPMGKPRMTRRDKWKRRPVVLRYREYCDRLRAAAKRRGFDPAFNCYAIRIRAYYAVKPTWSEKKRQLMAGKLMRHKPDWDNVGKAVCDALFEEDSVLGGGSCWQWWCEPGQERVCVWISYLERT